MAEHRLFLSPTDVSGRPVANATCELSVDGGDNWRLVTVAEKQTGVLINPEQPFVARIRKPGLCEVSQALRVEPDGLTLACDGLRDFGTVSLDSTLPGDPTPSQFRHMFGTCLSLFRDAMPDRIEQSNNQPPAYMYTLLAFDGSNVLADGGSGLGRFTAHQAVNVLSYGPNLGDLLFVKSPTDSNKPRESVVFVPAGLDLTEPVPMHVFYSPSTGGKKLPYPYSDGDNSFNAMIHNYLVSGGKRFLSQHVASGKACVFVFPLPSPNAYFSDVQTADSLRKFCLEVAYYLQRTMGKMVNPQTRLGTAAL